MKKFLRLKIKSLAFESKSIKEAERSIRNFRRMLLGVKRSRRHNLDQKPPEYKSSPFMIGRKTHLEQGVLVIDETGTEATTDQKKELADRAYEEFWGLKAHRINEVRKAIRASQIALGFLNGRKYSEIEPFAYQLPAFESVRRQVVKYGSTKADRVLHNTTVVERYAEWERKAKEWFLSNQDEGTFVKLTKEMAATEAPNEAGHVS